MNIKIKFALSIALLIILSIVFNNAYAEYYIVYPNPPANVTVNVFCGNHHYVRKHRVRRHHRHLCHPYYHPHHRYHVVYRRRHAVNISSICDLCRLRTPGYSVYYAKPISHTEAYIMEYQDHDFDRATADDVFPDMNIDN